MANYTNNLGQIRLGWRTAVSTTPVNTNDVDATTFITAAGITDSTQISAINTLVSDLKTYGLWTKMKAIYPFVGGSAASHKWNLKDPRDLDAAYRLVFNGGWVHSSTGALPNGTTGYANTYLSPSSTLSPNSTHVSYYSRSNNAAEQVDFGTESAGGVNMLNAGIRQSNSYTYFRINRSVGTVESFTLIPDSRIFYMLNRTSSTEEILFTNTTKYTFSKNSTGLANLPIYIGAYNKTGTAGYPGSKECAFFTVGDGLTDTEAANFYISVQKFQTTLGRHVGTPYVSDTDAIAFLMAAGITDGTQAAAINTLVIRMKADGVWTKMKAIYPFVGGTAFSHKWNLKDPRDLDAAYRLVFNGGGAHSSTGYKGNGSNSYADSKFPANTLSPGNAHLSFYNRTSILGTGTITAIQDNSSWDANKTVALGVGNTVNGGVIGGYFAGGGANSTTVKTTAWTSLSLFSSIATNSYKIYNAGIVQGTSTANSTNTFSTSNLVIGAHAGALNYIGAYETSFVSFGNGLTDAESTNLYSAVQSFQTTLGRQTDVPLVSDTDAQAFLNAANITSFQQASAVNKLVVDLKAAGVWTKMKAIYPFVGGSAASHKFNLKDPRDLDAAYRLAFNGGWTHTGTGAKPNGSNGYADTFVVPKNVFNATTFNHVSYYSRTNSTLTTPPYRYDLGIDDYNSSGVYYGGLSMIIKRDTNATAYSSDYGTSATYRVANTTTSDSLGLFIGSQTGTNIKLYKNNSILASNTQASISTYNMLSPLATRSIWIGTLNELNYTTQNRWSDKESAFISIGEGLNDTESTALYTAVQKYQTSLGRQVTTPIYNDGLVLNLDAGNANSYPGTGTTWFDLASGNNGTLVNGPTYDVNNNGSLSFSTNKYVTIPTGSAYNFGTSDFTIEGWVNLNSISTDQFLVSKFTSWMGNLDFVLRFEFAFRKIFFHAGDGPSITLQNSYNLVANTWYNYCISRVSGVTTFYLNGVAQSSHTGSVNIPNDKTDIRLGYAQDNSEPLNGRMSNFKVYNRGLSATEILNNFNSTRGRFGL